MSNLNKPVSVDANQALQQAFNQEDQSLTLSGFATSKVGNLIFKFGGGASEDYYFVSPAFTLECIVSDVTAEVTTESTDRIVPDMLIRGTAGIGGGYSEAYVVSVDSATQFTMNVPAAEAGPATIDFYNTIYVVHVQYTDETQTSILAVERTQ